MARSVRKFLLQKADQALNHLDQLDLALNVMDDLHKGRQPAITNMAPTLLAGHDALRVLWKALKAQL